NGSPRQEPRGQAWRFLSQCSRALPHRAIRFGLVAPREEPPKIPSETIALGQLKNRQEQAGDYAINIVGSSVQAAHTGLKLRAFLADRGSQPLGYLRLFVSTTLRRTGSIDPACLTADSYSINTSQARHAN